jgi:uncharacterized protein YndB with AHSA1/START domain
MANNSLEIVKDLQKKQIIVTKLFDATQEELWQAWTKQEYLDQWWAPNPWKAETKSLDFKEGGSWLYAMVGPDDSRHWARVDFLKINAKEYFEATDCFCDEDGNINIDFPTMHWLNEFRVTERGTKVIVQITFPTELALQKILEMGFEAGFTMALNQLELHLSADFKNA